MLQNAPFLGGILNAQHIEETTILDLGPENRLDHVVAVEEIGAVLDGHGNAGGEDIGGDTVKTCFKGLMELQTVDIASLKGVGTVHTQCPHFLTYGVDGITELLVEPLPAPAHETDPGFPHFIPQILPTKLAAVRAVVADGGGCISRRRDTSMRQELLKHIRGVVAAVEPRGGGQRIRHMDAGKVIIHQRLHGLLNKEILVICAVLHSLQAHQAAEGAVITDIADLGIVA